MAQQIFLIAPADGDAESVVPALKSALAAAPISALLLPKGARSESEYANYVKDLAPISQQAACAVLLDNRPDLVTPLGADGVHMTTGIRALREAVQSLKPDFIIGTADLGSKHEAMLRGELEIDYLMFGDREDSGEELANWWAETFEIPSVFLCGGLDDPALKTIGAEFLAFYAPSWMSPDAPAKLERFRS